MSEEKDVVEIMRVAIREEYMRQYRDDDRAKLPGGVSYFEDYIGPEYQAQAVVKALEAKGYKITRSLTPGIIHPREEYKGE